MASVVRDKSFVSNAIKMYEKIQGPVEFKPLVQPDVIDVEFREIQEPSAIYNLRQARAKFQHLF